MLGILPAICHLSDPSRGVHKMQKTFGTRAFHKERSPDLEVGARSSALRREGQQTTCRSFMRLPSLEAYSPQTACIGDYLHGAEQGWLFDGSQSAVDVIHESFA